MAATNVETMSSTSATSHNSNDRPMQPSSRGRQHSNRPRRHNQGPRSQPHVHPVLTSDRQKQPGPASPQQSSHTTRPPRKPPGLSTPPLKPADDANGTDMDDDEELCFICGNSMKERYFSLSPCGNAFCHICSLRLRALYKSTNCPFCKVPPHPTPSCQKITNLARRNMTPLSLRIRTTGRLRIMNLVALRIRMKSWGFCLRRSRFWRIRCYCSDSIVPIHRAT
jgi:hypothetical protein